jgi:hypothetical protein
MLSMRGKQMRACFQGRRDLRDECRACKGGMWRGHRKNTEHGAGQHREEEQNAPCIGHGAAPGVSSSLRTPEGVLLARGRRVIA